MQRFTVTDFCHQFISHHVPAGAFCIDATAGNGHDTEFLCRLAGEGGRVLAFDIQEQAVRATRERLAKACLNPPAAETPGLHKGENTAPKQAVTDGHISLDTIGNVICDSHVNLDQYASPDSADCIVFNFGYLPGGDHRMATRPDTSLIAVRKALRCLKPGGLLCLCIYSGGDTGFGERDTLLPFVKGLDPREYLVIVSDYANRPGNPPIPVFILKGVR